MIFVSILIVSLLNGMKCYNSINIISILDNMKTTIKLVAAFTCKGKHVFHLTLLQTCVTSTEHSMLCASMSCAKIKRNDKF